MKSSSPQLFFLTEKGILKRSYDHFAVAATIVGIFSTLKVQLALKPRAHRNEATGSCLLVSKNRFFEIKISHTPLQVSPSVLLWLLRVLNILCHHHRGSLPYLVQFLYWIIHHQSVLTVVTTVSKCGILKKVPLHNIDKDARYISSF